MRRWLRITVYALCGVLLGVTAGAFVIYKASQDVPEFYQIALKADPQAQQKASHEMLQRTTALASEVKKEGDWQAVFTAEQINGWLAVDMEKNYPDLLPSGMSDPRVAIDPRQLQVACRLDRGKWKGVVSMGVDVYLAAPNVAALRIRRARAGLIPIPLKTIIDHLSEKAEKLDLAIRWRQADGDPVAEIPMPSPRDADDKKIRIETLRLGEGKVYLGGSTEQR